MGRLVRERMFETNSSSSHSITVTSKPFVLETPVKMGVVVGDEEFGWNWTKHNDFETKLKYCIQDGVDRDLLCEVIEEVTGDAPILQLSDEGYIDHQSVGTAREKLTTKEDIKNFLFNKNSWLFGGNDNLPPPHNNYDVPTYDEFGNKTEVEYPFVLKIDKVGDFELKTVPTQDELRDLFSDFLDNGTLETGCDLAQPRRHNQSRMYKWNEDYTYHHPNTSGIAHFISNWTDYKQQLLRFCSVDKSTYDLKDFETEKEKVGYVELAYEIRKADNLSQ